MSVPVIEIRRQPLVAEPVGCAGIEIALQSTSFVLCSNSNEVMSEAIRFLCAQKEMSTDPLVWPIVEIPLIMMLELPVFVRNALAEPLTPAYPDDAEVGRMSPLPVRVRRTNFS